jgi:hypothetical protein
MQGGDRYALVNLRKMRKMKVADPMVAGTVCDTRHDIDAWEGRF